MFLIHQNVPHVSETFFKYLVVSLVKRFWSYEGRNVIHLAQIRPKSQFLFHKKLPPRDFSIMTLFQTAMKGHACWLQWCTTNVIGFLHAQSMHSSSIFFMFFIAFRCWFHSCFTFGYLTTLGAIWSIIICKSVRTAAILTLENSIPSSPPATQARPQGSHSNVTWIVEFITTGLYLFYKKSSLWHKGNAF